MPGFPTWTWAEATWTAVNVVAVVALGRNWLLALDDVRWEARQPTHELRRLAGWSLAAESCRLGMGVLFTTAGVVAGLSPPPLREQLVVATQVVAMVLVLAAALNVVGSYCAVAGRASIQ